LPLPLVGINVHAVDDDKERHLLIFTWNGDGNDDERRIAMKLVEAATKDARKNPNAWHFVRAHFDHDSGIVLDHEIEVREKAPRPTLEDFDEVDALEERVRALEAENRKLRESPRRAN